jgi:pantothenate kinase-related protein Tda10
LGEYQRWLDQLDAFIWLEAKDPRSVLRWRVEAEERMKAEGKPGMSLDEITAYIAKFLTAYELYVPLLRARAAESQSKTPFLQCLHLVIGENRLPETASKG